MTGPSVTVSILAYRSRATSERALASALALEHDGPLDVVVREQGGDDEECNRLRAVPNGGRQVRIEQGDNLGFAAGHNRSIRASTADFVLLLNADAELSPDYLRCGLAPFDEPSVSSVQGKLLRPGAAVVIDSTGLHATRRRLFLTRGQGELDAGQYDNEEEIFGVDGAAPIFRRAALEDVALPRSTGPGLEFLDEDFFAYKCEVDLAWRLRWRGWRSLYVPTATGWHRRSMQRDVGASWQALARQRLRGPAEARTLSFANHRLMQIKNESSARLTRDLFLWLSYEVPSWLVFLLTERGRFRGLGRLLRLAPRSYRKRKLVQRARVPGADPYRWFTSPRRRRATPL